MDGKNEGRMAPFVRLWALVSVYRKFMENT
jgi:hypothetical protein